MTSDKISTGLSVQLQLQRTAECNECVIFRVMNFPIPSENVSW